MGLLIENIKIQFTWLTYSYLAFFVFSYYFCMSVIVVRYASHTSKAPCKRTQHCWPSTPNMVGCYMLCPFTHPVACRCVLLHPFARGLSCFKSKSLLSIINIFTLYDDPYIFLICYYTFYSTLHCIIFNHHLTLF